MPKASPSRWKATPTNFLMHHATLIDVYKAKLADALRDAGLYDLVPDRVEEKVRGRHPAVDDGRKDR